LHALLDRLAEVSGWGARRPGDGWGMSLTHCFDSYCGHVVRVARAPGGGVRVTKAIAVMDCGLVLNPDVARAQVEGSIVMALGAATVHETTFVEGRAERANFDRYPMPLLRDIPPIDVHFIENDAAPGGVGEPGLPGFAPALVNAIFDLTGTRIRRLPFDLRQV
jgi:isoquinoline 1-oxidoreductase beta subunit